LFFDSITTSPDNVVAHRVNHTFHNHHRPVFTSHYLAVKMAAQGSAAAEEPIEVLFALQDNFDLMDFAGPLEVFTSAYHDIKKKGT